eukprot:323895-Prorocentrum_minimum.AAC.1
MSALSCSTTGDFFQFLTQFFTAARKLGLHTDIKPLLSHSTTGEFPPRLSAEDFDAGWGDARRDGTVALRLSIPSLLARLARAP